MGGNAIQLESGTVGVQVPSSVTIPSGATGVSFPITTSSVPAVENVRLTAAFGAYSLSATLTVIPGLARVYASPTGVLGGVSTHGVVQLSGVSTVSQTISLSASNSSVTLPASVTIPAGSSGVSFVISTKTVTATHECCDYREGGGDFGEREHDTDSVRRVLSKYL